MKPILQLLAAAALSLSLSSCLFDDPVFTEGFSKADSSLAGVWVSEDESKDPREREFAVLLPSGEDGFTLNYPVGGKSGFYFEVKPLKVSDKDIWQVRVVASVNEGLQKKDAPAYTLLWVEKTGEGQLTVRSLKNDGPHTAGAAATKKALLDKKSDWNHLFGEAKLFVRLKDR